MTQDVQEYANACLTCARNKCSMRPTTGLLNPLSIPWCPWSHVSLAYVTVEWFSKMVHFILLPKQPSAKETAEALFTNVVQLHGFPVDVVSD